MNPEVAKAMAEEYTGLIEGEFPATCKVLAAVKDDARDYRPDPKSRTAWELATHLATSDIWFLDSVIRGGFTFDPEGQKKSEAQFGKVSDVVEFYKREVPERLRQIRAMSGEKLTQTVDFFGFVKKPAVSFIGMANNHSIHHRGQLAAYLRACGSKVPAIYGASADEPMPGA